MREMNFLPTSSSLTTTQVSNVDSLADQNIVQGRKQYVKRDLWISNQDANPANIYTCA